jgi:electron transfer flavoprotein alpha subunit
MSGIWVVIEHREGRIARISLEAVAAAQGLLKKAAPVLKASPRR